MVDREKAQEIARALAPLLGAGWTFVEPSDPRYPTGFIAGPEGRELGVHVKTWGANAGRATVSGRLPNRDSRGEIFNPSDKCPEIGVDGARESEGIAAEIRRRLLPQYELTWAAAQRKLAEHEAYLAAKAANLAAAREAAGPLILGSHDGRDGEHLSIWCKGGDIWGDVRATGDRTMTVELRGLSVDVASAILRLIAGEAK